MGGCVNFRVHVVGALNPRRGLPAHSAVVAVPRIHIVRVGICTLAREASSDQDKYELFYHPTISTIFYPSPLLSLSSAFPSSISSSTSCFSSELRCFTSSSCCSACRSMWNVHPIGKWSEPTDG